jgi:hypothetical protein
MLAMMALRLTAAFGGASRKLSTCRKSPALRMHKAGAREHAGGLVEHNNTEI